MSVVNPGPRYRMVRVATYAGAVLLFALMGAAASHAELQTKSTPRDSSMTIPAGEEGAVFKDLVVEGEDLIQIEFERPELHIDVDPQSAPGLHWGSTQEILDRNQPDLVSPLVGLFAYEHFSYHARPWLDLFASDDIVRFRPSVTDLERWKLTIANSRGETVASFEGKGKPPDEIGWDGGSLDGEPVPPGLTYSYVFEAFDRAGNKRNFVGEGFELPPYCVEEGQELVMLFSGRELSSQTGLSYARHPVPPPMLLDVANRINQSEKVERPVRLETKARSFDKARVLAETVVEVLDPLILGGKARIQSVTLVEPDAPSEGAIKVVVPRT